MNLLEQIDLWHVEDEHQRIVDAVDALPGEERTAQLISLQARAYNNLAEAGEEEPLRKAVNLLASVEEELGKEHSWNFRMGYAYYYLDEEEKALPCFEQALEALPGDEDTLEFIADCRSRLALPRFTKTFRQRTQEGWASFQAGEAELRGMLKEQAHNAERLTEYCTGLLRPAFTDIAFEMGMNGEKAELILTPEGSLLRLLQLLYFQRHAPAQLMERWNIFIGRQPCDNVALRALGRDVTPKDVTVYIEVEDGQASLSLYCGALQPLVEESEGQAIWLLSILLDQTIGELAAMECIASLEVLREPKAQPSITLDGLADALREQGMRLDNDPARVSQQYCAYEMKPDEDGDADLRMDVFAGVTLCPAILNEYLQNETGLMDAFHADGAVPGFFFYPLTAFASAEERGDAILTFRENLEAAVRGQAGEDAVTFLGGASGIYYGYLDFIAWDLPQVLDAAVAAFGEAPVEWAAFHTFRREVGGVTLKQEPENKAEGEEE